MVITQTVQRHTFIEARSAHKKSGLVGRAKQLR
jgi:hypothetical protein